MSSVKVWREGTNGEPKFPENFEVLKKATLQVTDIVTNRNKYYAIELHSSANKYRVYTHYGRTDDLETNPNAGIRESRYSDSSFEAEEIYNSIYKEKTSARKGYKELSLASSKIGSRKTIGQSSGTVDTKTLEKMAEKSKANPTPISTFNLNSEIEELVKYLYGQATHALTTSVNATITANGIETPLGVLTIGQIEKGQVVLDELVGLFERKTSKDKLVKLSGEFYTVIPHRFGRSREAAEGAVIDTAAKLNEKQETLQLMRDMLSVNGKTNVLVNPEIEQKYKALNCQIDMVDSETRDRISKYVIKSAVRRYGTPKINNVWRICRKDEQSAFTSNLQNQRMLFHGSAIKNWVGILSRGLLLPKIVVELGVKRTDAGWLGNGIYFGDAIDTSLGYAASGRNGYSLIAIADVALGKMKDFTKITYGLKSPPDGYNSCHGVRGSQFSDDEYVIYAHNQQKLSYLVECKQ